MEPLPGWLASWKDEHLEALRQNLAVCAGYPDAFRHTDTLDLHEPHEPPASF